MATRLIAAIDQGTTSSRCLLFDEHAKVVAAAQKEHRQIFSRPGWVEHDPVEIWENVRDCLHMALARAGVSRHALAAIGITNQRETCLVWDRQTGKPIHNAIVWQDTRTEAVADALAQDGGRDRFRQQTGLPLASYFSAAKIALIIDHVPGARKAATAGRLAAGTIDSWLIWNLTGRHVTDVTNAHRTQLMNLQTLDWDEALLDAFHVPRALLPEIASSSEIYGAAHDTLAGVPVAAALGDQQAALVGQGCLAAAQAKCTYGTGNFLLVNTGGAPVHSANGLLTTVAYRFGDAPAAYALEGSVAVTGALIQWLRDKLKIISTAAEVETLAASVEDNGGAVIVPAFSGLFTPHWRPDARGIIAGLTGYVTAAHLCRAALEAVACQTAELVEAMQADTGLKLDELHVDGGMTANTLLMQLQADLLDRPVTRPALIETTCLGAAWAAGIAIGFWDRSMTPDQLVQTGRRWEPARDKAWREGLMRQWDKAVSRAVDWV